MEAEIYLDNAATSWPKPPEVGQAMVRFLDEVGANPGRSGHRRSIEAARIVYDVREMLAGLFGLSDPCRVVLTANCTEALNLAIRGLLSPGDHVVTSSVEHNAVMRPLRALEQEEVGLSVVGTLEPVREVGQIAREHGVPFLLDAAQSAGAHPIDMGESFIDLLALPGHKGLYGPMGTGALLVGEGVDTSRLSPLVRGGTGSRSELETQPEFLPDRFESGTMNAVGLAGWRAGLRWLLDRGIDAVGRAEAGIMQRLIDGLTRLEGVEVQGGKSASGRAAVVSFNIRGRECSETGQLLEERWGILCRVGLHCAPAAHKTIGTFPAGSVRLSPGAFTTGEEIAVVLQAVEELYREGR